jgi:hypothetical protein
MAQSKQAEAVANRQQHHRHRQAGPCQPTDVSPQQVAGLKEAKS